MSKKKTTPSSITNRRARFDYELIDHFTAGMVLSGAETKSLRGGNGDLRGSYVQLKNEEAWLIGSYIANYKYAKDDADYDSKQSRKLLLSKKELSKLAEAKQKKLTLVPLRIITKGRYIKLELATAKGRKSHDKRQYILKRQHKNDSNI